MPDLRDRIPVKGTGDEVLHGEDPRPHPLGLPAVLCEADGAVLDPAGVYTTDIRSEITCPRCRAIAYS